MFNPRKRRVDFEETRTSRIPRAEDNSTIGGIFFDLAYAFLQLVDALVRIILVTILVLRAKMSPLEAIHGPQVALPPMSQPALL